MTPFSRSVFPPLVMSTTTIVFDPYAAPDLRNIVQTMVDYHNVAMTGQGEWYPVAFFLRAENGEVLGGLLGALLHDEELGFHPTTERMRNLPGPLSKQSSN